MTNAEVTVRMTLLKNKYADGKFWSHRHGCDNDPYSVRTVACTHSGVYGCNSFGGGSQCHGFALHMAQLIFGSYPKTLNSISGAMNGVNDNGWKIYTNEYCSGISLEKGDIIRANGHTAIVWKVSSDGAVKVAEVWGNPGNSAQNCRIAWGDFNGGVGGLLTEALIKANATYIVKAPKTTSSYVTVNFKPNGYGATCPTESNDFVVGSAYGIMPTPSRSGYTFIGWWPESDQNSQEYTLDRNVPVSYDHNLYAHWAKTFKITNNGTGKCLSISGSNYSDLGNGIAVKVSNYTGANEQKWLVNPTLGAYKVIKSVIDPEFGLCINSSNAAIVHRIFKNETNAIFTIFSYGDYHKIIKYDGENTIALTANPSTDGLSWTVESSSNINQRWTFTQL